METRQKSGYTEQKIYKNRTNILDKNRLDKILRISLPIIAGVVSQNIINIVDTAMVGSLGTNALAAVGMGGFIVFMSNAIIMGLSAGVQASTARRIGEKKDSEAALSLNGGILIAVLLGIPLAFLIFQFSSEIFAIFNSDPEVQKLAVPYIQVRLIAIVAVGINFSFRGYWNGRSMSQIYMKSLMIMHFSNFVFSFLFIYGYLGFPELGAMGSGVGTAVATYIASFYYFFSGYKLAKPQGFLRKWPSRANLARLIKISFPSGMQSFMFAFGFATFYWIIGRIGTNELAAANVIINISLICILPAMAFGLSIGTLAGQSLGENDPESAKAWGWDVVKICTIMLIILSIPIIIFPEFILSGFIRNEEVLTIAIPAMRIAGFILIFESFANVLMHAQVSVGDSKRMLIVQSSIQWMIFLPAAYLIGPVLGYGLVGVWIAQGAYRLLIAIAMTYFWNKGLWANAEA